MKKNLTTCLLAGIMLAMTTSAWATTYFVKVNGSSETDGSSWEQAINYDFFAQNLEDGNFEDGDIICFAGGTYKLNTPDFDKYLLINRNLTFRGGFDPASTGTNTTISYPSPFETIISGGIESDIAAVPGNRTHLWYIQRIDQTEGITTKTRLNVSIKGFTFKHAFRNYDSASSYKGAVMVFNTDLDMQWCKFIQNGAAYIGSSGITLIAAYANIYDCLFSENFSGEKGAALGLFASSTYPGDEYKTTAVVQRCQITDNYFSTEYYPQSLYKDGKLPATAKLRGSAVFMGSEDERLCTYLINCLIADNYTEGYGCVNAYPGTTLYMISNTVANKDYTNEQATITAAQLGRGLGIFSYGGFNYMANNYIVNPILGNKSATNPPVLMSRSNTSRPGKWYSGGYNLTGTAWYCTTWAVERDRTQTPEIQATTFLYLNDKDKETYTYPDVFGTSTFSNNGGNTETLPPLAAVNSLTVGELNALMTQWNLPQNIDLSVDQRGYKRSATTCVGSYDANAIAGVTTHSTDNVSLRTLGNGIFQLNGIDGEATLYNSCGNIIKVVSANDVIDLSALGSGMYIITAGKHSFKVIL